MEKQKTLAQGVFNFLGGLSGLISIALIIWKGGVLWQMVDGHEHKIEAQDRRIEALEAGGSIGLKEHVKLDDSRVGSILDKQKEHDEELKRQREVSNKVIELVGEVKLVNFKLDEIKKQIERK